MMLITEQYPIGRINIFIPELPPDKRMASPALPPPTSGGVNASMWTNQPGPPRGGWGRGGQPGSSFRAMSSRGRPGGRGGGRGGRGGRSASTRGAPLAPDDNASKSSVDQGKDKPKPIIETPKPITLPIHSSNATPQNNTSTTSRAPNRPKPARKASESKGLRKAPSTSSEISSPAPQPQSASNAASTNSRPVPRRKRSHTHNNKFPPQVQRASLSIDSNVARFRPEKLSATSASKDPPPHLVPHVPETPSFDIKHDIDALVERVRAVAMDRPNTPGSHIDWAGDEDDSLPDLDDWGVTSTTLAEPINTTKATPKADVISPILEGTLRPLPSLADLDTETPSTTSGEIHPDQDVPVIAVNDASEHAEGDSTPHAIESANSSKFRRPNSHVEQSTEAATAAVSRSTASPKIVSTLQTHPSLPPKPVSAFDVFMSRVQSVQTSDSILSAPSTEAEPKAHKGLAQSMHAPPDRRVTSNNSSPERESSMPTSSSAPSHIMAHSFPHIPRGGFNATHSRSHTLGRPPSFRVPHAPSNHHLSDHLSDNERPRRGDIASHARTHSSPPTGPGTAHAHARMPNASRPVITVAAISKLARQLGGTPLARRDVPTIQVMEKD